MTRGFEGRWMTLSENLLAFDMGMMGGMAGRLFGGAGAEARNMFGAPGKSVCFVAGTQVAVAGDSGTITGKAIEDIELGDWVWSRNDETGEEGYKPVVHLFRNTTEDLAHLTYTTGSGTSGLTGTPGHKFWSETHQKWAPMAELKPGEQLKLADGSTATVSACTVEHLTQPVAIYNFEVADWHTYHVGSSTAGWVWVHSKRCAWSRDPAVAESIENGELSVVSAREAGVTRSPRHHIFPEAERAFFAKRRGSIDRYNMILDEGTHGALHYGGGPGRGGGWWNEEIMSRLYTREAELGRELNRREALGKSFSCRRQSVSIATQALPAPHNHLVWRIR